MFKNKPEVIDPEEKNLTYYSYRNKEEKKLEETSCCKSAKNFKPHFKMMIVLLIMVFALYFFAQKNLSKQAALPAKTFTKDFSIVLSAYQIAEQKKVYAQIMFENQKTEPVIFTLNRGHFVFLGVKNQVVSETFLTPQEIVLQDSPLKPLTTEITALESVKKIKAFLIIDGQQWALEKNL